MKTALELAAPEPACSGAGHLAAAAVGDNRSMVLTLQAVYENGILRPLEPVSLPEHRQVTLTLSEPAEACLDLAFLQRIKQEVAAMEPAPSLSQVREALSGIPGNLADDIRAEREGR